MVGPAGPPYQAAGLVQDAGDEAGAAHRLLLLQGGGQGGEGLAGAVRGNALAAAGGADGAPPAGHGGQHGGGKVRVLARWSLPLPHQGGEPGAVQGVVLRVLRDRLEMYWFSSERTWSSDCFVPKRFSNM